MNIKYLIFACGLIVSTLSIATPLESVTGYTADSTSVKQPVSKQPSSEKKTFSPKRPTIRIV